jgi:hypothetical protein
MVYLYGPEFGVDGGMLKVQGLRFGVCGCELSAV